MDESLKCENTITFKQIIKTAYPVIISMLSLNIMLFVDRAFVAQYNLTQFSAIMPAGFFGMAIANIFLGISGYASIFVSQYYGAGKYKSCSSSMWQGVYASIILSIVLLMLSPLTSNVFELMGHTGDLLKYERHYYYFIIASSCVQLFSVAFSSIYIGIGDTRIIMFAGITTNISNIILDWILVFGKFGIREMGIYGSGMATFISCIIGVIIYIVLLNRKIFKKNDFGIFTNKRIDIPLLKRLMKYGLPAGIQSFVSTGYFSFLLLIIGKTGEFNLSCSNIAFTIEGMSVFPLIGLGTAIGIVAAQERGAGRVGNIPKVVKKGIMIGFGFNLILAFVYNFSPGFLVSIFNSGSETEKFILINNTAILLVRLTSIWLAGDTVNIILGSVLRSVGDTLYMLLISMIVPFLFYIVFPYIVCVIAKLPLFWLWIELVVYTALMVVLTSTRFLGGKWKSISVI